MCEKQKKENSVGNTSKGQTDWGIGIQFAGPATQAE